MTIFIFLPIWKMISHHQQCFKTSRKCIFKVHLKNLEVYGFSFSLRNPLGPLGPDAAVDDLHSPSRALDVQAIEAPTEGQNMAWGHASLEISRSQVSFTLFSGKIFSLFIFSFGCFNDSIVRWHSCNVKRFYSQTPLCSNSPNVFLSCSALSLLPPQVVNHLKKGVCAGGFADLFWPLVARPFCLVYFPFFSLEHHFYFLYCVCFISYYSPQLSDECRQPSNLFNLCSSKIMATLMCWTKRSPFFSWMCPKYKKNTNRRPAVMVLDQVQAAETNLKEAAAPDLQHRLRLLPIHTAS